VDTVKDYFDMDLRCAYNGPMAAKKRATKAKTEIKEESLRLRVTTKEKEAWARAAKKDGRGVSGWLRFLANREAGLST